MQMFCANHLRLSISSTDYEADPSIQHKDSCVVSPSESSASNDDVRANGVRSARISEQSSMLDGSSESVANRSVVESEDESAAALSTLVDPEHSMGVNVLASVPSELDDVDESQAKRPRMSDDEDSGDLHSDESPQKEEHNNTELAARFSGEEVIETRERPVPTHITDDCASECAASPVETHVQDTVGTKRSLLVDDEVAFSVRRRLNGS